MGSSCSTVVSTDGRQPVSSATAAPESELSSASKADGRGADDRSSKVHREPATKVTASDSRVLSGQENNQGLGGSHYQENAQESIASAVSPADATRSQNVHKDTKEARLPLARPGENVEGSSQIDSRQDTGQKSSSAPQAENVHIAQSIPSKTQNTVQETHGTPPNKNPTHQEPPPASQQILAANNNGVSTSGDKLEDQPPEGMSRIDKSNSGIAPQNRETGETDKRSETKQLTATSVTAEAAEKVSPSSDKPTPGENRSKAITAVQTKDNNDKNVSMTKADDKRSGSESVESLLKTSTDRAYNIDDDDADHDSGVEGEDDNDMPVNNTNATDTVGRPSDAQTTAVQSSSCGASDQKMASIGQLAITKPAPDFQASAVVNGEFQTVKLSDYKGKYVVLFFYPLDFTFVCPTEIIAFSDRVEEFRAIQCEVLACSTDSQYSHLAWVDTPRKQGGLGPMKIPLLADKTMEISKKYGCLKEDEGVAFRGLFIIDDKGNLRQITINDLPVGRSVDETLRLVQAFQFTDKHGEVCPAGWKPGKETMKPSPKESQKYFNKVN